MFITFEGGEGTGKSTQANLLKDFLIKKGFDVVLTREPGGTSLAETIRNVLLTGSPDKIGALPEALMYLSARADHWDRVIKPALDAGKVVICDRFHDSSIVYQGICKDVDIELLNAIYANITQNIVPDRTYLIDLDPQIGIKRSLNQKDTETRFEKMDIAFHNKVRQAYLDIANQNKQRFLTIDGGYPVQEIHNIIKSDIQNLTGNLPARSR